MSQCLSVCVGGIKDTKYEISFLGFWWRRLEIKKQLNMEIFLVNKLVKNSYTIK